MIIARPELARISTDSKSDYFDDNSSARDFDPMESVVMWRALALGSCAVFWYAVIKVVL